jgi:hypothetical protein
MQSLKNYFWISIIATTLLVWYFFYVAWTTEYDENANNLVYSILTSILNLILLLYLDKKEQLKTTGKKLLKFLVILFGTPLTFIFVILYCSTLKMNYVTTTYSAKPKETYQVGKFRNLFKARNTLINKNLSKNLDTIVCEVKKNGNIQKLYRLKNGQKVAFNFTELKKLSEKQQKELISY